MLIILEIKTKQITIDVFTFPVMCSFSSLSKNVDFLSLAFKPKIDPRRPLESIVSARPNGLLILIHHYLESLVIHYGSVSQTFLLHARFGLLNFWCHDHPKLNT